MIYTSKLAATACAFVLAALWLPAAGAGGSGVGEGHSASFVGCHEQINLVSVPMATARRWVPAYYTVRPLLLVGDQTAVLHVSSSRCDSVTVSDTVLRSVTMAIGTFEIDPPAGAEHDPDDADGGDAYVLFIATDSERLADWLRRGTGLQVHHVPLRHEYTIPEPFGVAPFFFKAPEPPDWAFTVRGAAGAQKQEPLPSPVDQNYWRDTKTPDGKTWRVRLRAGYHDVYVAPAAVAITAEPGSELEEIMVTNPTTPTVALSVQQAPWDLTKTVTRK